MTLRNLSHPPRWLPLAVIAATTAVLGALFTLFPSEPSATIAAAVAFIGALAALGWWVIRTEAAASARDVNARWVRFERAYRLHIDQLDRRRRGGA